MRTWIAVLYRQALRSYPPAFRAQFGDDLLTGFLNDLDQVWRRHGAGRAAAFAGRAALDAVRHGVAERWSVSQGHRPGLRLSTLTSAGAALHPGMPSRRFPMSNLLRDVRLAVRALRHAPGFTLATVVTIALGLGAVTTVLAALYGVVLRPLPFDGSSRVVRLCETHARIEGVCVVSAVNLADWAARASHLEVAGVARQESFALREGDRPQGVRGAVASAGFLRVVSAGLIHGRHFEDADLGSGAAPVALVSHAFWTARLGADPAAVGRDLALDGRRVRVVGVLAPDVYLPGFTGIDIWKPLTASIDDVTRRDWRGFVGYARLRPGRSQADLRVELDVIRGALAQAYPAENRDWGLRIIGLREDVAGPAATTLWLLLAAAVVLGLVACVNVASLVTVRTAHRAREFAVRAALGAGWRRLAWPLLLESLIVSVAGGLAGLAWASAALRLLVRQAPRPGCRAPRRSPWTAWWHRPPSAPRWWWRSSSRRWRSSARAVRAARRWPPARACRARAVVPLWSPRRSPWPSCSSPAPAC